MRIVSLSFGGIRNGQPAGMSKVLLPLYQELYNRFKVEIQHFVPQCSGYEGDIDVKPLSPIFTIIYRMIRYFGRILHVPNYISRHISIYVFDMFAKRKIRRPEMLIISHLTPKTLKKNKALGGKNILIMGNPNPDLVYGYMMDIQKKYSVVIRDAYTYRPSIVKRWRQSVGFLDSIVCGSETMKHTFDSNPQCSVVCPPRILASEYELLCDNTFDRNPPVNELHDNRKLRFCFLAHTVWLKGLHTLLEAWEMLDKSNAELHIGGRINTQYKKWIDQRFSFSDAVVFHGRVPDLREFYMANDVFICPSLADAGPGTINQALSCGLPVIASNGCGHSELITDGCNGYVFPVGDAVSLCEYLQKCIDNPRMVREMSSMAIDSIHKAATGSALDFAKFFRTHLTTIENS